MDFDHLFLLNKKEKSTKSMILRALIAHQQLTITQLQKIIKKEFQKKITYQAIRQALMELEEKNILKKEKKCYSISSSWVLELKDGVHLLERSLIKKQQIKVIDKTTTQITLKNLYELGHFILFGLEHEHFNFEKGDALYVQLHHLSIPFTDNIRREQLVEMFRKSTTFVAIKGKTLGDRMLEQWYKKYCKVKMGVAVDFTCDTMVNGGCIVQVYMPEDLKRKMDRVYSLKSIATLNIFKEVYDMTYDHHPIEVIITRNKEIAEQCKQRIERYF